MRAKLEFDLEDFEEKSRLNNILKNDNFIRALERVGEELFRPARKHGYSDDKIRQLVEKYEGSEELIGALEEKFYSILNEENAQPDEA